MLTQRQLYGREAQETEAAAPGGATGAEVPGGGVLDEEAQMQIVPPPKPHHEAALRKAAKELAHLLTHKPANPYCEICIQAKMIESPHRKGSFHTEAKHFGEYCTGDYIVGDKDGLNRWVGGFRDALTLRDHGTTVKMCYPIKT